MRVVIVGAGAMGSLFGAYLRRAEHDVALIERSEEKIARITERGLQVEGVSGDFEVWPTIGPGYTGPSPDLALVCVKAYDTASAGAAIASVVGPQTVVLTVQNGVGNVERLAHHVGRETILAGTTALGANLLAPGRVHHAGEGETHIGELGGGTSERAERIATALTAARLPTSVSEDVSALIWSKLAINVGINALTALLQVRNGRLLVNEGAARVLDDAVAECLAVAAASGIELDAPAVAARVREVARLTASNRSSMLVDFLENRRTEIDAINGAVVRRGEELGVPVPVNTTLTNLVHAICAVSNDDRERVRS